MNLTIIQKSIDYIEDNLKTDITAKELSEMAGFSMFHYYRLFHSAVGLPVMQYITRRRLLNALYDIHCGAKMVVVALDYGFETQAGFYKAFIREFGYTPTEFLNMSKCKFVESEARAGDITLSDIPISLCETFDYPYEVKKYGASLISINNNRGIALLDNVGTALYIKQVDVEMNNKNKHTQQSPQKRDEFLAGACHSLEKTKLKHFGLSQKIKGSIIEILDNVRKK